MKIHFPYITTITRCLDCKFVIQLLCGFLAITPLISANAANPNQTLVGAIRWDGNIGDIPTFGWANGQYIGQQTDRALGPNKYHFRIPFFSQEIDSNTVFCAETNQAIMDQDIAYAKSAGINYWAFVFYGDGSGMDMGRNLYDSSSHKGDVNYCYIVSGQMQTNYFPTLGWRFAQTNYPTVLGGRPLVYFLENGTYFSADDITNLRNQTTAAGLANPYVVVMRFSASDAANVATLLGADAIGNYTGGGSNGGPYSQVASSDDYYWNQWMITGWPVVPWITGGWDPRPRIDNPVAGHIYATNNWSQEGAPWQIASHLQEGLNWVDSNPTVAEANTVLIYAWNELDEGYNGLCPTLYTGTDNLDALKQILLSGVPGTNLLSNPGFESGTSPWYAQSASIAQDPSVVHSGTYSCLISGRTAIYGAAVQNVKNVLLANGQGYYDASVWAAFASGSDTLMIVINTVDSAGSHWFTTKPMALDTNYKQILGTMNVTWTGTLSSAVMYTQTGSSTSSLYEDDFNLDMLNRISNPGFENGTTSWTAQSGAITTESSYVHGGSSALLVTNRTAVWGTATQSIKNVLLANGPGGYRASAWLSFATATDNVQIVISTVDSTGTHWFTTAPVSISTRFKNISDTINVTWTGTLSSAKIYTQSATSRDNLYEDDFSLIPQL